MYTIYAKKDYSYHENTQDDVSIQFLYLPIPNNLFV